MLRSLKALPVAVLAATLGTGALALPGHAAAARSAQPSDGTRTPIEHVVVIFQENVSYDHYFGTYPNAANAPGETPFQAANRTPHTNGLTTDLLTNNPNTKNPQRLTPAQQLTCDQDHEYTDEQAAFDNGKMDLFVQHTDSGNCGSPGAFYRPGLVMDYYDGNTVTGLWNYAQHFAMSDNSYNTTFGPSTPGAVNLVSGQTHGVVATATPGTSSLDGEVTNGTIIGDPQPLGDDCSTRDQVRLGGTNVGDLLNANGVTWGWFEGGFKPTTAYDPSTSTKAVCGAKHNIGAALGGTGKTGAKPWGTKGDYIPHHEPFQYYASTANPHHLPPTSASMVGHTDQANHQYDLTDFWSAADNGNLPAVSYLKAAGYQDGHAGYSTPADEQQFLVDTINHLQQLPEWSHTAVIVNYDDSDGWYDHRASPMVNQSATPFDALTGTGQCGNGQAAIGGYQGRCGYGPRLPMMVISPYARENFVAHNVTDQSSILRFIEDNWRLGRIGDSSFDVLAGSLRPMFQFNQPRDGQLVLDRNTGTVSQNTLTGGR
jgi:phospholipase C